MGKSTASEKATKADCIVSKLQSNKYTSVIQISYEFQSIP